MKHVRTVNGVHILECEHCSFEMQAFKVPKYNLLPMAVCTCCRRNSAGVGVPLAADPAATLWVEGEARPTEEETNPVPVIITLPDPE